jgi:nucleotide-binding universal stress UspA family protein
MFTKILLCSDGSEHALAAAAATAELATKFNSEVVLVNVFNPAVAPIPFVGLPEAAIFAETNMGCYAEQVQSEVEKCTGKVLDAAHVAYRARRELGHPVDRIVSVAQDEKADLIVMGSRGMGAWQSYLLGSVSDGVIHHAHCPVLILK